MVNLQLSSDTAYNTSVLSIDILLQKIDEAIDDIEQGRVQSLEDAWQEIDNLVS